MQIGETDAIPIRLNTRQEKQLPAPINSRRFYTAIDAHTHRRV